MLEPYQELERSWSQWNDLDPAGMVVCSSGTAALHLALEALELPLGSKVLVPDYTMIACPRAVTLAGMEPVFVDCDERLLLDFDLIRDGHGASALMIVHVYGRQFRYPDWVDNTDLGLFKIEDLAEAHGVKPHKWTTAACWSFYKNKIIAGEEGGAVWFRDPKRAVLARSLRSMGFTEAHDYTHVPRGHNYRMSNANAAEVLHRGLGWGGFPLGKRTWSEQAVKERIAKRREIEGWYEEACPVEWRMPPRDAPWVYDLRIPGMSSEVQGRVVAGLRAEGIEARHGFKPCSDQREYRACRVFYHEKGIGGGDYGRHYATIASWEVVYLPISPGKTTREGCRRAFEITKSVVVRS